MSEHLQPCRGCVYWVRLHSDGGQCRRNAPGVYVGPGSTGNDALFPYLTHDQAIGCGDRETPSTPSGVVGDGSAVSAPGAIEAFCNKCGFFGYIVPDRGLLLHKGCGYSAARVKPPHAQDCNFRLTMGQEPCDCRPLYTRSDDDPRGEEE